MAPSLAKALHIIVAIRMGPFSTSRVEPEPKPRKETITAKAASYIPISLADDEHVEGPTGQHLRLKDVREVVDRALQGIKLLGIFQVAVKAVTSSVVLTYQRIIPPRGEPAPACPCASSPDGWRDCFIKEHALSKRR
ncbi:hypothetical protein SLS56_002064 [Neofusicoccum ribis]|uniref:Uncharacterized protein n=1 Tax=Neofusicoccum ribis TaxID=45134 RepID=A0ABR3T5X8_9PEZI